MPNYGREIWEQLYSAPYISIADNSIPGWKRRRKFGRNPDVDTGTDPEDVWTGGGIYTGQPESGSPELVTVTSSSTDDVFTTGTGAWTIRLIGLDGDFNEQEEDVNLDGTNLVDSTLTWWRLPRARIIAAGTDRANQGQITVAHKVTTANVFIVMPALLNRTAICCDTIPANKTGFLLLMDITSAQGGGPTNSASIELLAREENLLYEALDFIQMSNSTTVESRILGAQKLPAKTDWVVRVREVTANDTAVSASVLALWKDD